MLFSPDEKWLIVDDHAGSSEAMVYLFKRMSTLEYRQSPLDLNKALWDFFYQHIGATNGSSDGGYKGYQLDHIYISSDSWSPTCDAVLFCLNGHGGGHLWAENWQCIYDFAKKKVTLDLGVLNRGAVGGKDLEPQPPEPAPTVRSTKVTSGTAPVVMSPPQI